MRAHSVKENVIGFSLYLYTRMVLFAIELDLVRPVSHSGQTTNRFEKSWGAD
jgi:hypothetical protein